MISTRRRGARRDRARIRRARAGQRRARSARARAAGDEADAAASDIAVHVSCFAIRREKIEDLISSATSSRRRQRTFALREDPEHTGRMVTVPGLLEVKVNGASDVAALVERVEACGAATSGDEPGTHKVFSFTVGVRETGRTGRLLVVQLASEVRFMFFAGICDM